ncbi:MAG: cupin domain-containing protein [Spirochaetaceae bacterium]|jgi:mannose-6-phosphate isomerase-like protein (cupin superfamily)|nr:cupin domain-containing protein [Spirochaetaceae bacterium]
MIIRKEEQRQERLENARGGEGVITFTHHAPREVFRHEKLFAEITLPPGASIGEHVHNGEIEYYVIQSGEALVHDGGKEAIVRAGDCVITGNGSAHSIKNTGALPLVFEALIVSC